MAAKKTYKLDLKAVLNALDKKDTGFYNSLTEEEKKSYTPLVLMRYMSSLADQNPRSLYAIVTTNDLVNIGFWSLSKHPELQHLLLCLTGTGSSQYRPWIPLSRKKKNDKIESYILTVYPDLNDDEITIIKNGFDALTWKEFVKDSGATDDEIKELSEAWKKQK